jgi:hypothetical protein
VTTAHDIDAVRGALEESYAVVEELTTDLSDSAWEVQSLCPD